MMKKGSKRDRVVNPVGIEVSEVTKEKLQKIQADSSKRNMDLVIRELLSLSGHDEEDNSANSEKEYEEGEEGEDDGKTPLPQMKFSRDLLRNDKALKYYTGLHKFEYLWVQKAMQDVVRFSHFFSFTLSGAIGLCSWTFLINFSVPSLSTNLIFPMQLGEATKKPAGRRNSNAGFRKLPVDDRILLFLMRMRRRVPFEGLRLEFGVSIGSADKYYKECLQAFHTHVVPRLLYPLSAKELDPMIPPEFAKDLPGCRVIFDLTGFALKGKENVLLSRILWSAYHHRSEAGALFGMYL